MFQKSEVGKHRSKKSQAEAMLNKTCVTPNGDEYSLVDFEKKGTTYHYTYKWLNCPDNIKGNVNGDTVTSKGALSLTQIMDWISNL